MIDIAWKSSSGLSPCDYDAQQYDALYTTSATIKWNSPPDVGHICVIMWGSGGGGAYLRTSDVQGWGGGAGAFGAISAFPVKHGVQCVLSPGVGGKAATSVNATGIIYTITIITITIPKPSLSLHSSVIPFFAGNDGTATVLTCGASKLVVNPGSGGSQTSSGV